MSSFTSSSDVFQHASDKSFKVANPDQSKEECIKYYDEWSSSDGTANYESFINSKDYGGPAKAAQTIEDVLGDRKNARILDVAAGTGHVGEKLRTLGFQNLDALEPSEGMLRLARSKNIYKQHYSDYLDDTPLDISEGTYDAIVVCGSFVPGHIPCVALHEMIRLLKSGGYWVNVMREQYLREPKEYRKLEPLMQEIEDAGSWRKVSRTVFENYIFDVDGVVHVYQKA